MSTQVWLARRATVDRNTIFEEPLWAQSKLFLKLNYLRWQLRFIISQNRTVRIILSNSPFIPKQTVDFHNFEALSFQVGATR